MFSYGFNIISFCWTARHFQGWGVGVCRLVVEAEGRLRRGSSLALEDEDLVGRGWSLSYGHLKHHLTYINKSRDLASYLSQHVQFADKNQ